jgi:RNA polymerase sigma factor (sigma-70 family)
MSYFDSTHAWETYYPSVYGYFFRRVEQRQDVEDLTCLVLEDFLQVLSSPEKMQRIQNIHAYLWRIAHNYLADFIDHKTKRQLPISLDENLERIDQMVDEKRSDQYQHRVTHLLECMKKELRGEDYTIVQLSVIEDLKSSKIGEQLSLKAENVRKKLSRALQKLRERCRAVWES